MKKYYLSVVIFLCSLLFGCAGSASSPPSQPSAEVRARQDFARNISQNYPFRVSFGAQGKDREILDIIVIEEISPSAASGTVDFILTDKLKKDAKALKFTRIQIKGGRKSFFSPDTIDETVDLR